MKRTLKWDESLTIPENGRANGVSRSIAHKYAEEHRLRFRRYPKARKQFCNANYPKNRKYKPKQGSQGGDGP